MPREHGFKLLGQASIGLGYANKSTELFQAATSLHDTLRLGRGQARSAPPNKTLQVPLNRGEASQIEGI